jgi:hypothetical protein
MSCSSFGEKANWPLLDLESSDATSRHKSTFACRCDRHAHQADDTELRPISGRLSIMDLVWLGLVELPDFHRLFLQ